MTENQEQTSAESLGAPLKSARDIMRKDKELNGDIDRLSMLTWIMFLKLLDDLESQLCSLAEDSNGKATLGEDSHPAIGKNALSVPDWRRCCVLSSIRGHGRFGASCCP